MNARHSHRAVTVSLFVTLVFAMTGCDQLGIETADKLAQRKLAESKAVGAGCRHATRAIEDCYVLNPKADKAAVFEGWREMDEYMRENKLEGITPVVPRPETVRKPSVDEPQEEGGVVEQEGKPASSAKSGKK